MSGCGFAREKEQLKGKQEGLKEGLNEIALKMLEQEFSVEQVAQMTGLDVNDPFAAILPLQGRLKANYLFRRRKATMVASFP